MSSAWASAWGLSWGSSWVLAEAEADPSVGSGAGGGSGATGWDGRTYPFQGDEKPVKALGYQRAYFDDRQARRIEQGAQPATSEPVDATAAPVQARAAHDTAERLRIAGTELELLAREAEAIRAGMEIEQQAEIERQRIEEADLAFVALVLATL